MLTYVYWAWTTASRYLLSLILTVGMSISRNSFSVCSCIFCTHPVQTLFLFKPIWTCPQGSQGCQKIRFFYYWVLVLRLTQKSSNFENLSKLKKKCQKSLFSYTFLNILQFRFNLSAPNLKWGVQWMQAHLLTLLGSLGADLYRRYQGFSICFSIQGQRRIYLVSQAWTCYTDEL